MYTIKKIKEVGQSGKLNGKKFGYNFLMRGVSKYITYFFLKIFPRPIHPALITILRIFLLALGSFLFAFNNGIFIDIISLLFFYFAIILDKVDGEIARLGDKCSIGGAYFDSISHLIEYALFFSSAAIRVFLITNNLLFIFLGFLGVFSSLSQLAIRNYNYYLIYKKKIGNERVGINNNSLSKGGKKRNINPIKMISKLFHLFNISYMYLIVIGYFLILVLDHFYFPGERILEMIYFSFVVLSTTMIFLRISIGKIVFG
jgi:phosphatidylglycerophosphate synthase